MKKPYLTALTLLCLLLLSILILAEGRTCIAALGLAEFVTPLLSRVGGVGWAGIPRDQFEFVIYGLVPVAFLWLGAGVATALTRIKDSKRRSSLAAGCYFLLPVLIGVGLAVLVSISMLLRSDEPGWQALKPMPEPAKEIVAGDDTVVYVRSVTGKIYGCAIERESGWQEASEPLNVKKGQPIARGNPPPRTAVSTLDMSYYISDIYEEVHYAVLADQSVWWYRTRSNAFTPIMKPLAAIIGMVAAFLAVLSVYAPIWLGGGTIWLSNQIGKSVSARDTSNDG